MHLAEHECTDGFAPWLVVLCTRTVRIHQVVGNMFTSIFTIIHRLCDDVFSCRAWHPCYQKKPL